MSQRANLRAASMLVDTHTHIHDGFDRDGTPEEIFAHAHKNGVEKIITIGTGPEDSEKARIFAEEWAKKGEKIYWTWGYHPNCYEEKRRGALANDLNMALEAIKSPQNVGIGEIGLDYHFDGYSPEMQRELLLEMLQIAQDQKKPVTFHIREAFDDFWPIFDNFHLPTSVLHSYSDSKKNLKIALEKGFYIGVNGLATFADIAHAPLERIVFETDAPYLTPAPFRGKMNKPGCVKNIAEWASDYYKVSLAEVEKITTQNAESIYRI